MTATRLLTCPVGKGATIRAAASGAVSTACALGLLATSGWLITKASTRPPVYVLSVAIGAVQAFALGRGIFRYLQRLSVHDVSLRVLNALRLQLFDDVEPLVPGGLSLDGNGGVLSAFVTDAEAVATGLVSSTTAAVDVVTSVVLGTVVAAVVAPRSAALLAVGSLVVIGAALVVARMGRRAADQEAALRAELAASVVDTMRSARELVVYGRQDLIDSRLSSIGRRSAAAALRQSVFSGLGRAVTTWLTGLATMGVVVMALSSHDHHHLSGVMVAVVVFTALATFDQLGALPLVLADTTAARSASTRLSELSRRSRPVIEPPADRSPAAGPLSAALLGATVVASDGTAILDDAWLNLDPGGRIALVGPNGCGKTTAVNALLHFVDCDRGQAVIGGMDVRGMTRDGIARHVGWMADSPHIFAATVAENLRIARPTASDADCQDALVRVGLAQWLMSLPDGLETLVGSGGRPVSAGEGQRLGLARSLLAGGSILLLDEPTAHIDPASSAGLVDDMLSIAGARSVLLVSHDPDIADHVDRVVALGRNSRG
jgi:thiol reductant ABC exporter CydC subunit